jgi:hypothetical protein
LTLEAQNQPFIHKAKKKKFKFVYKKYMCSIYRNYG